MKLLYGYSIVLSLVGGFFILIQFPIYKLPTPLAVADIEHRFLRQDMNEQDKSSYSFDKRWILGNQTNTWDALQRAKLSGLGLCLLLFIQSFIGLVYENKKKRAEPIDEPNRLGEERQG